MIYKLRSESSYDAIQLLEFGIKAIEIKKDRDYPDCEVMFNSNKDLKEIRQVIGLIPDSHVMVETVNYIDNYTGIR